MAGIYVYSDKFDIAAELIGFAKSSSNEAYVICFTQDDAEQLSQMGADKVYYLNGDSPLVESYAQALADFLNQQKAELFTVGATARGRDLAARVAGYLDCAMVSDVSAVWQWPLLLPATVVSFLRLTFLLSL